MLSLNETLAYNHPGVRRKLIELYELSPVEAEDLFLELKRWLWLLAVSEHEELTGARPPLLGITPSLKMLDEAWHVFILFTRDYSDFCAHHFGRYIHHQPTIGDESLEDSRTLSTAPFRSLLEYVLRHLGRETLIKWYSEYHQKYAGLELRIVCQHAVDSQLSAEKPVDHRSL